MFPWIKSVFINPEYRKKGYFKYLKNHIEDHAWKQGFKNLWLCCDEDTLKLWKSQGFKLIDEKLINDERLFIMNKEI